MSRIMDWKYVVYNIIAFVQIIVSIVCYIPQFIKILKTKHSEDLSVSSLLLRFFSEGSYLILLIIDEVGFGLLALEILEIVQVTLLIALAIRYSDKVTLEEYFS